MNNSLVFRIEGTSVSEDVLRVTEQLDANQTGGRGQLSDDELTVLAVAEHRHRELKIMPIIS